MNEDHGQGWSNLNLDGTMPKFISLRPQWAMLAS